MFKRLAVLSSKPAYFLYEIQCRSREQGPILLLLGGGMAAGKSTVREIIGSDHFWSKVRMIWLES